MIGNAEDAAVAARGHSLHLLTDDGSTRAVYLINGVVYKREYYYGVNAYEYDVIMSCDKMLPEGVSYPKVSLYKIDGIDIIAMEYIKGMAIYQCYCADYGDPHDEVCMTESELDLLLPVVDDPSGRNVIRCESGYVIIDAA